MNIDKLKVMTVEDLIKLDPSKLTADELAYVEKRLSRVANRRLNRLKQSKKLGKAKLTKTERKGFKPYRKPKGYNPKGKGTNIVSNGRGKSINVRNKQVHNVSKIQKFLNKKTTKIRELNEQDERYRKVIRDTLGRDDLKITDRQLKRISKLMAKAQELAGLDPSTKKTVGSPRLLELIVDLVKSGKYIKNADAEEILNEAITNGYESAQELLNSLKEEDMEGYDMYGDDFDY